MIITIDLYGDTEDGLVVATTDTVKSESRELKEEVKPLPLVPALQIVPIELPK